MVKNYPSEQKVLCSILGKARVLLLLVYLFCFVICFLSLLALLHEVLQFKYF